MNGHEHTIADLLKQVYERMDMVDAVQELQVRQAYYGAVGDLIGRLTKEVHFANGELRVKLLSAALRNELGYKKQDLIDRINQLLNVPAVKKIILQ